MNSFAVKFNYWLEPQTSSHKENGSKSINVSDFFLCIIVSQLPNISLTLTVIGSVALFSLSTPLFMVLNSWFHLSALDSKFVCAVFYYSMISQDARRESNKISFQHNKH